MAEPDFKATFKRLPAGKKTKLIDKFVEETGKSMRTFYSHLKGTYKGTPAEVREFFNNHLKTA